MQLKRTLSILLLCALVLGMAGCKKNEEAAMTETTAAPTTEAPLMSAQEQYAAAKSAVDSATDVSLRITSEKSTTVGDEVFLENSEQILSITDRGSASMKTLLGESINYNGAYGAIYQETYADGMLYTLLDSTHRLAGNVDAQTYMNSLIPAVLLDASLYGSVEYAEDGTIRFSQPTAAESWALPQGAAFGNASGTAVIADDGSLAQSTYTVSYDYGSAQVTESITAVVTLKSAEILVPSDAAKYTKVQNIEAVRLSKQALGFLKQAKHVSSATTESISSMATGMMRSQNTLVEMSKNPELTVTVGTNMILGNYATGENQTYLQQELFQNGMYTISANGSEPVQKPEVTAEVISQYCTTSFEAALITPEFWKDVKVTDMGEQYMVECAFNENLTTKLRAYISQAMFSDENSLGLLAPNSATVELSGCFAVDKDTGLPVSASYRYGATDIMDGQEYMMLMEVSQSYQIAGQGSIDTQAPAETTAPAETAAAVETTAS